MPSHTIAWIEHAHARHATRPSGHGLHVVRAVLALGAVAVGDDAAEDAGQHLAADEEAEREVHVRGGDAAERAEDQDATSASMT